MPFCRFCLALAHIKLIDRLILDTVSKFCSLSH